MQSPHFLLRRAHSLIGLVPVGAFLLFHLWENSQSRFGQEHYNTYVVEKIQNLNYVRFLEIFLIALPDPLPCGLRDRRLLEGQGRTSPTTGTSATGCGWRSASRGWGSSSSC